MKKAMTGLMAVGLLLGVVISGHTNTDPGLNGTWVWRYYIVERSSFGDFETPTDSITLVLDNGNFLLESFLYHDWVRQTLDRIRGTFSNSSNTITMHTTYIHRDTLERRTGPEWIPLSALPADYAAAFAEIEMPFFRIGNRLSITLEDETLDFNRRN